MIYITIFKKWTRVIINSKYVQTWHSFKLDNNYQLSFVSEIKSKSIWIQVYHNKHTRDKQVDKQHHPDLNGTLKYEII